MPIWKFFTSRVYQVTTHVGEKNSSRVRNSLERWVEAVRGTSVEMSWALLAAAISRFTRSQREQGAFYSARTVVYRGWGSRNSRCSIVEGRPFRNKGPLIFHLTAWQRHSTPPRDSHVCPLTPCLVLTPTGVLRTLCSNRLIIDTIADSLWYFNDTAPRETES